MRFLKFLVPIFLVFSTLGLGQSNKKYSEDKNPIVFDGSKSLPGNLVLDKLNFLEVNSADIQLPTEVSHFLSSVEGSQNTAAKITWARVNKLRILYNPKVSKADKIFVINFLLEKNNEMYQPIFPF